MASGNPNVAPMTPIDPTMDAGSQTISSAAHAIIYPPEAATSSTKAITGTFFSSASARIAPISEMRLRRRTAGRIDHQRHRAGVTEAEGTVQRLGEAGDRKRRPERRRPSDDADEPHDRHDRQIAAPAFRSTGAKRAKVFGGVGTGVQSLDGFDHRSLIGAPRESPQDRRIVCASLCALPCVA